MNTSYKEKMKSIKAFVFDIDGVMTDGTLLLLQNEQVRTMNIKDGFAIHEAIKAGYHIIVISGGAPSQGVRERLNYLNIKEIHLGVENKTIILNEVISKYKLASDEIAYMGDDIPDLKSMEQCGLKACPADAVQEIKSMADFISVHAGGKGCVRDLIEQVMRSQQKWPTQNN